MALLPKLYHCDTIRSNTGRSTRLDANHDGNAGLQDLIDLIRPINVSKQSLRGARPGKQGPITRL